MGASSCEGSNHYQSAAFLVIVVTCFVLFCLMLLAYLSQINAINAATEAACLILSVDETVKNPKVTSFPPYIIIIKYNDIYIHLCSCFLLANLGL